MKLYKKNIFIAEQLVITLIEDKNKKNLSISMCFENLQML